MIHELFEALGNLSYAQAKEWNVQTEATAHTRLAIIEYVLYVIATLIKESRFDVLQEVLASDYLMEYNGNQNSVGFNFLMQDVKLFDDSYNDQLAKNWKKPSAEWLRERATSEIVTWENLLEADALLHIQSQIRRLKTRGTGMAPHWWGITGSYWNQHSKFPLFLRFGSRKFLNDWAPVLGLESAQEFREILDFKDGNGAGRLRFEGGSFVEPSWALSLEDIATRP